MLRFLADENFNNDIVRGVLRRDPDVDIVRVQDIGLSGATDAVILEEAADQGRLLLTHDVSTVTRYAYERVSSGQPMPGVVEVRRSLPLGEVIPQLILLARCSQPGEWVGQALYLPL